MELAVRWWLGLIPLYATLIKALVLVLGSSNRSSMIDLRFD